MSPRNAPSATGRMSGSADDIQLNSIALEETLKSLRHLSISPSRLDVRESAEVGSGGYGEVVLATLDPASSSPREVAVKRLRAIRTQGVRIRMAFRLARELKIWAQASHPNILELIGFHLSENYETAQLISPYMPHGNVSQYIAEAQPEVGIRIAFVKDTAAGLEYLHSCDPPICHGDLKAANVLVTHDIQAVLCDFGLAQVVESADDDPSGLTTSHSIRGSTRYMAPELILSTDGVVRRTLESDVWAWGCLLYEIMTDTFPYAAYKADITVIQAIIRGKAPAELPLASSLTDEEQWDLRSWFIQLVLPECWNFDPLKRPTMADAVREMEVTLREIREELERKLAIRAIEKNREQSFVDVPVVQNFMDLPLEERVRTILKRNREEEAENDLSEGDEDGELPAQRKRVRLTAHDRETNHHDTGMTARKSDPSEPRYCYCDRRGIGPYMIRCDDYKCSRKWFDLECVGLKESPKGQWRCQVCKARRRGEIHA